MVDKSVDPAFDSVNTVTAKMNVFESIATRRSIRKFTAQDVPMELIGLILDAGRYAPSSGNIQNWRFILVRDLANRGAVADACLQQLWIAQAPILIVVVAETEKLKQFYGPRGEMLYAIQNCSAAIQNMILTTHALGLGTTWVSTFNEDALKSVLGMPGDIRPQAVLPIGFPDEVVPAPVHYTLENVTYIESFGNRVANIERVFQNPLIFTKIQRLISSLVNSGKEASEKIKKK